MSVKLTQPENAEFPIIVIEDGMVILAKLVQTENAPSPITVTEEGMIMLVKLLQLENAEFPTVVTEDGMAYVTSFFPAGYAMMVCMVLSNRTPSTLA
jgi:hypothetical protein